MSGRWKRLRALTEDYVDLEYGTRPSGGAPLPLSEGKAGKGLTLGDDHTNRDRRLARQARSVFHAVLATDLNTRGAATTQQLYCRLSWFMLPFNHAEIEQLIDSTRRAGVVECINTTENQRGCKPSGEWMTTEEGRKLKRPRALSLPDLGRDAISQGGGLTTVFGSVKGVVLGAIPFLTLLGAGKSDLATETKWAVMIAGLAVLLIVLGNGVLGDLRLRAATRSWPRLENERGKRFEFQLSYRRMAFIPALLLCPYVVVAVMVLDPGLPTVVAVLLGLGTLLLLAIWWKNVRRRRDEWNADDQDPKKWRDEWRRRARLAEPATHCVHCGIS